MGCCLLHALCVDKLETRSSDTTHKAAIEMSRSRWGRSRCTQQDHHAYVLLKESQVGATPFLVVRGDNPILVVLTPFLVVRMVDSF